MSERELERDAPVGTEQDFERDATTIRHEDEGSVVRHEEEASVETRPVHVGSIRVHKTVETGRYEDVVPRGIEQGDVERSGPMENDTGEIITLPDGSVSVPLLEEEIIVTKRMVVRERVIIRKRTVTEEHTIEAAVRRERISIDADEGVPLEDDAPATT